jgi:5-methylcytosine-specific restriction endonuclease McrA
MTIQFNERVLEKEQNHFRVSFTADNQIEWRRVLSCIKSEIPKSERKYIEEQKEWKISNSSFETYIKIKEYLKNGEMNDILDESIKDEIILESIDTRLKKLPDSMKNRATFAIKAAMEIIDVPVEFCFSERMFGAYNSEENVWVYEDGRYSGKSPSERDNCCLSRSYKQTIRGREFIKESYDNLENPLAWKEKSEFRLRMLEDCFYQCFICEIKPSDLKRLHMHRVIPGKMEGEYTDENVVILCPSCHRKAEGKSWEEIEAMKWDNLETF